MTLQLTSTIRPVAIARLLGQNLQLLSWSWLDPCVFPCFSLPRCPVFSLLVVSVCMCMCVSLFVVLHLPCFIRLTCFSSIHLIIGVYKAQSCFPLSYFPVLIALFSLCSTAHTSLCSLPAHPRPVPPRLPCGSPALHSALIPPTRV